MSGGVDSSVAAYLLSGIGADVTGVAFDFTGKDIITSAETVAKSIGIPFISRDFKGRFAERVIRPFVDGYASGITPNPCVICNPAMKWSSLIDVADEMGIRFLATGHFVRTDGRGIIRGIDRDKDQSYFLYRLKSRLIERSVFPVGGLTKPRCREIAREAGLIVHNRPESHEVCFFEKGQLTEFLRESGVSGSPGEIVDVDGNVLGRHEGWASFTIGQRRGHGVASANGRLYVVAIEPGLARITLGPREAAMHKNFEIGDTIFHENLDISEKRRFGIQIRHLGEEIGGEVHRTGDKTAVVNLDEAVFAPAPGQSTVFYNGESVAGGGIIRNILP